jgi:hypothetical protein
MTKPWMTEILQKARAREQLASELAVRNKSVRLFKPGNRAALASHDMSAPGSFRLTLFESGIPVGHTEHTSLTGAIKEGLSMGYHPNNDDRLPQDRNGGKP